MKKILTNKDRTAFNQIIWITISWMLIGVAIAFYEYSVLLSPYVNFTNITLRELITSQLIATFIAGLTGGTVTVIYFQKWIRTKPYGQALIMIIAVYSAVCLAVSYAAGCYFYSQQTGMPPFSKDVQNEILRFISGVEYLRIYIFWLFIMLSTIIALLVNDKYGPGIFIDFLLGKYFRPRREERIFMFLDLRSSTTIAEQLGEEKYFHFLKEVFKDVTPPILYAKGEIYQYVGDEIIVSWKMHNGLENINCINSFFEIKKTLSSKSAEYLTKYGIVPEFKAGLHYGHVMAGEIGVVKRDITFLGDVLNTTARIQEKCNEFGVNILFSKYLSEKLMSPFNDFSPKQIGEISLRGKQEKVILFTI